MMAKVTVSSYLCWNRTQPIILNKYSLRDTNRYSMNRTTNLAVRPHQDETKRRNILLEKTKRFSMENLSNTASSNSCGGCTSSSSSSMHTTITRTRTRTRRKDDGGTIRGTIHYPLDSHETRCAPNCCNSREHFRCAARETKRNETNSFRIEPNRQTVRRTPDGSNSKPTNQWNQPMEPTNGTNHRRRRENNYNTPK